MEAEGGTRGGGAGVGWQSPTQLDRVYVWPGSTPATCPDISETSLGRHWHFHMSSRREGEVCATRFVCKRACLRAFPRVCASSRYVWALMCIVLFFTLAWWPGKSPPKGSETLRRALRRRLMDLYQAVKIDNCHSSSGCLEVNPDQQGLAKQSNHGAYKSQHASVSFGCP